VVCAWVFSHEATIFRSSTGEWVLTGYADCKSVLADQTSFGIDWARTMAALEIQGWQDHPSLKRISSLLKSLAV
jgi:hypothetical protein